MVPTPRLGGARCSLHRWSYSPHPCRIGRALDPIHVALGGKARVMMTRERKEVRPMTFAEDGMRVVVGV